MKKTFFVLFYVVAVSFFSTGCVIVKEYAPEKDKMDIAPQEYELARKLVRAFVINDGKAFVALLPEETRTKFTVETFEKTRKSLIDDNNIVVIVIYIYIFIYIFIYIYSFFC